VAAHEHHPLIVGPVFTGMPFEAGTDLANGRVAETIRPPSAWEGQTVARFAFLHPHTSMDLVREIFDRMD
jgi:hypothetical protein